MVGSNLKSYIWILLKSVPELIFICVFIMWWALVLLPLNNRNKADVSAKASQEL